MPPTAEQQFIEVIRSEWQTDQQEAVKAEIAPLKKQLEDHQALTRKNFDDQQIHFRTLIEKSARHPFSGTGDGFPLTLGEKFVQSEQFKSTDKHGRFSIKATFEGHPVTGRTLPAGMPPLVGGPRAGGTPPEFISSVGDGFTGWPIWPQFLGLVPTPLPPLILRGLINVIPISGTNAVEYVTENLICGAGYQLKEGDRKSQCMISYEPHMASVVTIACYFKISRQMFDDVPAIVTNINQRLVRCILEKEEAELFEGDGAPGHLLGLFPALAASDVPEIPAPTGGQTPVDQILNAIAQVQSYHFTPDAIVVNGQDWARIQGLKNSFGSYLLPGLPGMAGFTTPGTAGSLWGLRVVISTGMPLGHFVVGQFSGTCAIFDRQTVNVETANQNEDDFLRNLLAIRGEERLAFAVFQPHAFATGNFTDFNFNGSFAMFMPCPEEPETLNAQGQRTVRTPRVPPPAQPVPAGEPKK